MFPKHPTESWVFSFGFPKPPNCPSTPDSQQEEISCLYLKLGKVLHRASTQ